ncbi:MAG: HAD family hydrolase [Lysobacterales bacterium]|jgi:HAD superfamily hydrolase (TIGR01509 family)|nr:MAG: HAD family hydrolase [Xanthomonadales bacterium]
MQALLWDVDGTLAETELDGHLVAFNAAFEALEQPWRWSPERYGELLRVAGGFERLLADLRTQPSTRELDEDVRRALARRIHVVKNQRYSQLVSGGALPLRPGVRELFDECAAAGVCMAVVTTTSRGNVQALLSAQLGSDWSQRFATIVGAEDAPDKKPDPQAYRIALERLYVQGRDALAIEDSPAGLRAATCAGVPCVITRSRYFPDDPVPGALAVGPGLGSASGWTPAVGTASPRVGLAELRAWHGRHRAAS